MKNIFEVIFEVKIVFMFPGENVERDEQYIRVMV